MTPDNARAPAKGDEKPLPAWTRLYPESARQYLATWGGDPAVHPRAHELNLRLMEVVEVIEKARPGLVDSYGFSGGNGIIKVLYPPAMGATSVRVGIYNPPLPFTEEEEFAAAAGRDITRSVPVARSPEEIEVRADWRAMYLPEYVRILGEVGVPTVCGTQVDEYNRRLTELLPADCVDPLVLNAAAADAFKDVFCQNLAELSEAEDRAYDGEMTLLDYAYAQGDLEDVGWVDYPARFRSMLQRLGRPDYEHSRAIEFNNALIQRAERLQEDGFADSPELRAFHRRLWEETFGGEPYPL